MTEEEARNQLQAILNAKYASGIIFDETEYAENTGGIVAHIAQVNESGGSRLVAMEPA